MDCANTLTLCKHHTQFSTSGNLTLDQRKQDKDEADCWTITQKNWGANWRYSLCFTKYKKNGRFISTRWCDNSHDTPRSRTENHPQGIDTIRQIFLSHSLHQVTREVIQSCVMITARAYSSHPNLDSDEISTKRQQRKIGISLLNSARWPTSNEKHDWCRTEAHDPQSTTRGGRNRAVAIYPMYLPVLSSRHISPHRTNAEDGRHGDELQFEQLL